MGIVLLVIAILPVVGHGGMLLYRAEFSGARSDRLKPRIAETAMALWKIYVALSVAEFVALRFAGMRAFDALCHTFATLGTGGFSTRTASVGAFQSPAIEWIITIFMFLSGMSFIQHYRLFRERRWRSVLGDYEMRAYTFIVAVATPASRPRWSGRTASAGSAPSGRRRSRSPRSPRPPGLPVRTTNSGRPSPTSCCCS